MALKPIGSNGLLTLDGVDLVKFVPDLEAMQVATDNAIGNGDATTLQAAKDDATAKDATVTTNAANDATTKANTAKTDAINDATTKYGGLPTRVTGLEDSVIGEPVPGYAWAVRDGNRVSELAVGFDGRVPESVVAAWARRGTKVAPFSLTHADNSGSTDTRTAVHSIIPFKMPAAVTAFRVHIRNHNDRYVSDFLGAINFDGLAIGEHAVGTAGALTGKFTAAPKTIASGFSTPADGTEWVSPWLEDFPLDAGKDYLLSYGYTCAAQTNTSTLAGSWQSADNTKWNAVEDTTAVQGAKTPLDVWLEVKVAANVPVVAYLGDSLTVGVSATFPVYDSYPHRHARANGHIPVLYAHSGSTMERWAVSPTATRFTKWESLSKPDALVWSLGRNDIFADLADIATLRTRFDTLYPIITGVTSTDVYLTTVFPSFNATAPAETVRAQWNNILMDELLGNACMVFDVAKPLEASPGVLDSRWSASPTDIHLSRQGYARVAQHVNQPLHR